MPASTTRQLWNGTLMLAQLCGTTNSEASNQLQTGQKSMKAMYEHSIFLQLGRLILRLAARLASPSHLAESTERIATGGTCGLKL
jgi:hypothetical protein